MDQQREYVYSIELHSLYTDTCTVMCRCHLESQKEVCKQVITRLVCIQKTQSISAQSGLYWFIEASRFIELKVSEF